MQWDTSLESTMIYFNMSYEMKKELLKKSLEKNYQRGIKMKKQKDNLEIEINV